MIAASLIHVPPSGPGNLCEPLRSVQFSIEVKSVIVILLVWVIWSSALRSDNWSTQDASHRPKPLAQALSRIQNRDNLRLRLCSHSSRRTSCPLPPAEPSPAL